MSTLTSHLVTRDPNAAAEWYADDDHDVAAVDHDHDDHYDDHSRGHDDQHHLAGAHRRAACRWRFGFVRGWRRPGRRASADGSVRSAAPAAI